MIMNFILDLNFMLNKCLRHRFTLHPPRLHEHRQAVCHASSHHHQAGPTFVLSAAHAKMTGKGPFPEALGSRWLSSETAEPVHASVITSQGKKHQVCTCVLLGKSLWRLHTKQLGHAALTKTFLTIGAHDVQHAEPTGQDHCPWCQHLAPPPLPQRNTNHYRGRTTGPTAESPKELTAANTKIHTDRQTQEAVAQPSPSVSFSLSD